MVEGEDYGQIPGTPKPTLYKPGADKLCELYGLTDSYRIIDRIVDFDRGLFDYEIECTLSRDGQPIATGLGSCSSFEGKYRWRDSKYKCPACGKETIIKGKEEWGGGWVCFKKKGGCGAKFEAGDPQIEGQEMGQVENEDIATLKNTILKMAKKRSKVDATLAATRSSGVFTQDIGDSEGKGKTAPAPPPQMPQRKSESQTQPQAAPPQGGNGKVITAKQASRFWALIHSAKKDKPDGDALLAKYGLKSAGDIPADKYEAICAEIGAPTQPAPVQGNPNYATDDLPL